MSLLDRFVSPSNNDDSVRSSICRNLEQILESRRSLSGTGPLWGALSQSLYSYGLGNLHRCRSAVEIGALCTELEQLIERFEPRLQQVVVDLEQVDEQNNALCFHIEAGLSASNGAWESFDTTINLTNSTLMIEGYQP